MTENKKSYALVYKAGGQDVFLTDIVDNEETGKLDINFNNDIQEATTDMEWEGVKMVQSTLAEKGVVTEIVEVTIVEEEN